MLGAIDGWGHQKEPVYAIVQVTYRVNNVIHGKNHADYVDFQVFYNIMRYLQDLKEYSPALYHVGVGQFYPNITTEVDCESMFSQEGFIYEPM